MFGLLVLSISLGEREYNRLDQIVNSIPKIET